MKTIGKPSYIWKVVITALLIWSTSGSTIADLKGDVGYTRLARELKTAMPTGRGVEVTQVEATAAGHWMPDSTYRQFTGKTITDKTGGDTGVSSHAISVGSYFYGNKSSLTPGITCIDAYALNTRVSANHWIGMGFLMQGVVLDGLPVQPMYRYNADAASIQKASPSRVANHSWVGSIAHNDDMLRRIDYIMEADDFIQVVAVNNGTSRKMLLSGSFNALTVGRSDGVHPIGTLPLDSVYTAERICPLIVVPLSLTSSTTPVAASAAALLVQTGRETDSGIDPAQTYVTDRSGRIIVNAERSETIKAALMAGAQRFTDNGGDGEITDYRSQTAHRSSNGLDNRFGAGQLNIYNSYHIIAAGEQNSAEDDEDGNGEIGSHGFDVDPFFGGASNSNIIGTYRFTAGPGHRRFYASLVWHVKIDGGTWNNFIDTATLYDLNLALYDTTPMGEDLRVAVSANTRNNTENLWVAILPGRSYRLEVTRAEEQSDFVWDYALAWRMGAPLDTDGDGMDNEWEAEFGLDYAGTDDAAQDTDNDGLTALEEYTLGTVPVNSDTDGDGSLDGEEVHAGTSPLNAADYPHTVTAAVPLALVLSISILVTTVVVIRRRKMIRTR